MYYIGNFVFFNFRQQAAENRNNFYLLFTLNGFVFWLFEKFCGLT